MYKDYVGIKLEILPDKQQEELLFKYCEFAHKARNFLVSKYKNKAPKTSSLDAAIQEATVVEEATTPTTDYWEEELQSTTEAVEVTE